MERRVGDGGPLAGLPRCREQNAAFGASLSSETGSVQVAQSLQQQLETSGLRETPETWRVPQHQS